MFDAIDSVQVRGRVRLYRLPAGPPLPPALWTPQSGWKKNLVLYDWASIVSRLLAEPDSSYRISAMYLEFKNVADPADTVTAPSLERGGGVSYYDALADSADCDFLRVPLVAATRSASDAALYPDGNVISFFAQSQGVVGVHGKSFGADANSKIYGAALAATPDFADRTRDRIFSRLYLDAADQQVKLATSQLGLAWQIQLS